MTSKREDVQAGYDPVERVYADLFTGELAHKPHERALLDVLAAELRGKGKVVDVGCGPGQIARALHELAILPTSVCPRPFRVPIRREAWGPM
jgi:2-polyprenyl-3-methyl-5-hydroxy-6-metoxy-1,4-benzoquinol methylase